MKPLEIKEYDKLKNVEFPLVLGPVTEVKELDVACEQCDGAIRDLRIKPVYLNKGCVELKIGGYCRDCGSYESGKVRWYLEQNRLTHFREDGMFDTKLSPKTAIDRVRMGINKLKSVPRPTTS